MIRQITDSDIAREFLNSVPFDQYVPEGFPVCNPRTIILGWYDPDLIGCFPCNVCGREIEIHVAIKKEHRGSHAVAAGKEAIKWLFENVNCTKIFSEENSRVTSAYAILCGLKRNGKRFEVQNG